MQCAVPHASAITVGYTIEELVFSRIFTSEFLNLKTSFPDQQQQPSYCSVTWLSVALSPQKPVGLSGTGAEDGHLDFHTAPELCQLHTQFDHLSFKDDPLCIFLFPSIVWPPVVFPILLLQILCQSLY